MACPELCNKFPFSIFTIPFYLSFRGRWPELACGISGGRPWVQNSSLIYGDIYLFMNIIQPYKKKILLSMTI
jgi:hypothetical protein